MKQSRAQLSFEDALQNWRSKPRWWHEAIFIGILYAAYSAVRNVNGKLISVDRAKDHAEDVVSGEKTLHIFHEQQIQHFFLSQRWFIRLLDDWYGTAHFIFPIAILLWLYHRKPARYHQWRNVILGATFFAMIGYLIYPLAPPRLLPPSYNFVDTLDTIGGLWNFDSGTAKNISNQYAAMPSLHAAWSLWCAVALIPVLRRWWTRALAAFYPVVTITAIIVTANHYWFDVLGGMLVLALGYFTASVIEKYRGLRALRKAGVLPPSETEANLTNGSQAQDFIKSPVA